MSWDEMGSTRHTCPCGQGAYVVTFYSDDWGRSEDSWSMECAACRQAYALYTTIEYEKGLAYPRHRWVDKATLLHLRKLEADLDRKAEVISRHLQHKYAAAWLELFSGKSRPAIWSQLSGYGFQVQALSTFQKHTRGPRLELTLEALLNSENAERVVNALDLRDATLNNLLQELKEAEGIVERHERKMTDTAFA